MPIEMAIIGASGLVLFLVSITCIICMRRSQGAATAQQAVSSCPMSWVQSQRKA